MPIPKKIIFIIISLLSVNLTAQIVFYDTATNKEYTISEKTSKKVIKRFLKHHKAKAIEFNPNQKSDFPFRIKNKKGNWMLFSIENEVLLEQEDNYSFDFPSYPMEHHKFITTAKRKKKSYLVNLETHKIHTKRSFDEIVVLTKIDTLYRTTTEYDKKGNPNYIQQQYITKLIDKIAGRLNNKWGLIEILDDTVFLSRYFLYNSPEELPPATGFNYYQLAMMEDIRKQYNIDKLVVLDEFGYYFKGRDKQTKHWGVFMGEGEVLEHIPCKYDSIIRHTYPLGYEVWKNGKVGYYNGDCKLVFAPKFDDFKRVHLDYTKGCALKRSGQWELYDSYSPEKLVKENANTIDELIELWLDR